MVLRLPVSLIAGTTLLILSVGMHAQAAAHSSTITVEQAIDLAHSGRCSEAMPSLRHLIPQAKDKSLK